MVQRQLWGLSPNAEAKAPGTSVPSDPGALLLSAGLSGWCCLSVRQRDRVVGVPGATELSSSERVPWGTSQRLLIHGCRNVEAARTPVTQWATALREDAPWSVQVTDP